MPTKTILIVLPLLLIGSQAVAHDEKQEQNLAPSPAQPITASSPKETTPPQAQPLLRENIVQNGSSGQDNSVQSFFDCPPVQAPGSNQAKETGPSDSGKKSGWHSAGRALWHILDNAGVPMFFGNRDADLDPTIGTRAYVDPPDRLPTETLGEKIRRKANKTVVESRPNPGSQDSSLVSTPANPQSMLHKIPQSELEGTNEDAPVTNVLPTPRVKPDGHEQAQ